ncbi:hypothetical protein JQS43_15595 [Natronosporangium hydrolyticum]|uniref:Uncharacterized protein n=1 Tax=Natronosporangium hydrolyticum TaxID=2811111 RepID=A0A895YFV5_9ACTN|nr:hypothetical protein [Natronosporangium hydrolyticum]QSB13070.1 hypothetical protein JQS43_15595 [Natronosporangium hydrolyticum]
MPSARTHWRRALRRGAAAIAAPALLLTGCTASATMVAKPVANASPLAEFLGTPPRDQLTLPQLDQAERDRQDLVTELVAECMLDAGFEYVAVPISERIGSELLAAYELPPREFAHRYGYGATTIDVEPYQDPNTELRDQLLPAEQTEYDEALWGDPAAGGGCYLRSSGQVYGDPADREAGWTEFADLTGEMNQLYQEIDTDPRLATAHAQWAECMADAGHPDLTEPRDARQSVFDRLPGGVPPADPTLDPGPVDSPDPDRRAEVREYELALAPVDYECQRRHVLGVRRAVTLELEQSFIDRHQAELTRYRDWLGDG